MPDQVETDRDQDFSSPDVALDNADLAMSKYCEVNWYSFIPSGEAAYAPDDARPARAHAPIAAFTIRRRTLVIDALSLSSLVADLVCRYCRRPQVLDRAKWGPDPPPNS